LVLAISGVLHILLHEKFQVSTSGGLSGGIMPIFFIGNLAVGSPGPAFPQAGICPTRHQTFLSYGFMA
jgi:hypothetical protein